MTHSDSGARLRWVVLAVFVLSSAINYLDRQTLATLAPLLRKEFALSNEQYGWILAVFSVTYAAAAPFAGLLIDRIGLNRAISLVVGVWSCAGIATGFTGGLAGLIGCRTVLGAAEAGGIPGAGKAIYQYLCTGERALGNAANQAGVSLGLIMAPPVAAWIAVAWGWRAAFMLTGVLGLLWIPLWNWASRLAPQRPAEVIREDAAGMLGDRRLWAFVAANALNMIAYSLWTNWTVTYLVDVHGISISQAARYAWIPPAVAMLGGPLGGWLSLRLINRGVAPLRARFRACLIAAVAALVTAAVPFTHTPATAAIVIAVSLCAVSAASVNMYSMPLDAFGGARAAFAVSMLVASYGAVQAIISPAFGKVIDLHGYAPVTTFAALTPLAACLVLKPFVGQASAGAPLGTGLQPSPARERKRADR